MNAISGKALNGAIQNKKDFNGNEIQNKEFSDGSGLDFYDFNARTYDQQIGRFLQIDPLSDEENQEPWTPYHFGFNGPVKFSDPDGKWPIPALVGAYARRRAIQYAITEGARMLLRLPKNIKDITVVYEVGRHIYMEKSQPGKVLIMMAKAVERKAELEKEVKSLEKSVKSLEKNVEEHKQKLEDFKNDPDGKTREDLKEGKTPEQLQKLKDGRINALEKQIRKNEGELQKAKTKLDQAKNELDQLTPKI